MMNLNIKNITYQVYGTIHNTFIELYMFHGYLSFVLNEISSASFYRSLQYDVTSKEQVTEAAKDIVKKIFKDDKEHTEEFYMIETGIENLKYYSKKD